MKKEKLGETKEDDEEAEENAMRFVPGEEKRKAEKTSRQSADVGKHFKW
jgi:hypothetical protein